METETYTDRLAGLLPREEDLLLCRAGQLEELKKALRKQRCVLMDELHESQRKVDRIDTVIRQIEQEMAARIDHLKDAIRGKGGNVSDLISDIAYLAEKRNSILKKQ